MRFLYAQRWLGLLVSVIVLVIVLVVGLGLYSLFRGPVSTHDQREKIAELVSRIHGEAKFVVATQVLTVRLDRSDCWYLFDKLYLGETVVKLRVDDCKVQYFIPGDQVRVGDFHYLSGGLSRSSRLVATLPHPILDESLVDVPSDPSCWTVQKSSGWARFDKYRMEQRARAELRGRILEEARRCGWDTQIDLVAKESLKQFVRAFFVDPAMEVEITWR